MKFIKNNIGWIITVITLILTSVFSYGRLIEKVNNNALNIYKQENENIIIYRDIRSEIALIRGDCSDIKGDIKEINGYLKGKENWRRNE